MASARECPYFKYEYNIMKFRLLNNASYLEAEALLLREGIPRPIYELIWEGDVEQAAHLAGSDQRDLGNDLDDSESNNFKN